MDDLDVHPRITAALRKAKIHKPEVILISSEPDIVRATKLTCGDVQVLKKAVAEKVPKLPVVTAFALTQNDAPAVLQIKRLTTGCKELDKALQGGILSHGITEIVGESASGKTQLCLQLSLTAQLARSSGGLAGGAVYICTEDLFPDKRLFQMIDQLFKGNSESEEKMRNPGDHIYIEHVANVEGLMQFLSKRLIKLVSCCLVKLIVIDSIAAVFRSEYATGEMAYRAKHLAAVAHQLHHISSQHNIPIICVNQVAASLKSDGQKSIPALGLAWANQVTTRILLSKSKQSTLLPVKTGCCCCCSPDVQEMTSRRLEVVFAPHLPPVSVPFVIDRGGVRGCRLDGVSKYPAFLT